MIVLQNMGGIAPMMTPAALADNLAQTATNLVLHKGGVAPLYAPTTVATPTKAGTKQTEIDAAMTPNEIKAALTN